MTEDDFCALALAQDGAVEASHQSGPDFRAEGKIFAGLPKDGTGTLKLLPEEQDMAMAISSAFSPAAGAWGRSGWTQVDLTSVDPELLASLMVKARANVGPKSRKP